MNPKRINKEVEYHEEKIQKLNLRVDEIEKDILIYKSIAWKSIYGGCILAVMGIFFYSVQSCKSDYLNKDFSLNELGDYFSGLVGSVWTLGGLFFAYVAFLGQKQQLLYQQQEIIYNQIELRYTRYELEGQKKEMQLQNSQLQFQQFENTFFQLLRNHQEIVNSIDIGTWSKSSMIRSTSIVGQDRGSYAIISKGRDCFKVFYNDFAKRVHKDLEITIINDIYLKFYNERQSDLSHYFRHLYHILKFIDNTKYINEDEKFKYSSILRALLSSYELSIIFYNSLSINGKTHFKPLVEKYAFLKNLDTNILISKNHIAEFVLTAFESSDERQLRLKNTKK